MVTASEFKERFTSFSEETDSRIEIFLTDAALSISSDKFGLFYDLAIYNLAAHLLTMASRGGGAAGPVTSERVGELARGYAAPPNSDKMNFGSLASTPFGMEYERIRRQVMITPMVTCR